MTVKAFLATRDVRPRYYGGRLIATLDFIVRSIYVGVQARVRAQVVSLFVRSATVNSQRAGVMLPVQVSLLSYAACACRFNMFSSVASRRVILIAFFLLHGASANSGVSEKDLLALEDIKLSQTEAREQVLALALGLDVGTSTELIIDASLRLVDQIAIDDDQPPEAVASVMLAVEKLAVLSGGSQRINSINLRRKAFRAGFSSGLEIDLALSHASALGGTTMDKVRFLRDLRFCVLVWYNEGNFEPMWKWAYATNRFTQTLPEPLRSAWQIRGNFFLKGLYVLDVYDFVTADHLLSTIEPMILSNPSDALFLKFNFDRANMAAYLGRASEADALFTKAIGLHDSVFGEDSAFYSLLPASQFYASIGNCERAVKLLYRGAVGRRANVWRYAVLSKCEALAGNYALAKEQVEAAWALVAKVEADTNLPRRAWVAIGSPHHQLRESQLRISLATTRDKRQHRATSYALFQSLRTLYSDSTLALPIAKVIIAETEAARGDEIRFAQTGVTAPAVPHFADFWMGLVAFAALTSVAYVIFWASWLRPLINASGELERDSKTNLLTERATNMLMRRLRWELPWFGRFFVRTVYLLQLDVSEVSEFQGYLGEGAVNEALLSLVSRVENTLRGEAFLGVLGAHTLVVTQFYASEIVTKQIAHRLRSAIEERPLLQLASGRMMQIPVSVQPLSKVFSREPKRLLAVLALTKPRRAPAGGSL